MSGAAARAVRGWRRVLPAAGLGLVVAALLALPAAAQAGGEGDAGAGEHSAAPPSEPAAGTAETQAAAATESDAAAAREPDADHGASRLSAEPLPLQLEGFPQRPKPLVELGEPFLGTGTLAPGFELPTGAVWQPSLLLFGTLRTAVQSFGAGDDRTTELATRLDLFANLYLSGSERLVVGVRPLDRGGRFTSYAFLSPDPAVEGDFQDELNLEVTSLFFEGDFGEIFPDLSLDDFTPTDIGFSLGRQPLTFQDGMLIQDTIDALGVTRNTLLPAHTSNFRMTFLWGWNDVGRDGAAANPQDRDDQLFALLTSTDVRRSTIDADVAYVVADDEATGDLIAAGVSAVQRIGLTNTTFRLLGSAAVDGQTPFATDGALLFAEVSRTPRHSHDLVYFNAFWAIDEFTSAARAPDAGGPLGRAGISFAAVGLGSYGAPLSSRAKDVAGGAIGYQKFFSDTRKQLLVELGARVGTAGDVADAVAATARYQTALGRRFVVVLDGFAGYRDDPAPGAGGDELFGGRLELVLKF